MYLSVYSYLTMHKRFALFKTIYSKTYHIIYRIKNMFLDKVIDFTFHYAFGLNHSHNSQSHKNKLIMTFFELTIY